jgi:hypothetical protein
LGENDRRPRANRQADPAGLREAVRKRQKNDAADAEAIAEAAARPTMRFVAPKSEAQQPPRWRTGPGTCWCGSAPRRSTRCVRISLDTVWWRRTASRMSAASLLLSKAQTVDYQRR